LAHVRLSPAVGPIERFALAGDRVVVGRSHDCDLVLPDVVLSRRHAELVRTPLGWAVRDLRSLNGTYVNGRRLEGQRALRDGDVVGVAEWRLEYREADLSALESAFLGTVARLRDVTEIATRSDLDVVGLAQQSRVLGALTRAADALVSAPSAETLLDALLDHLLAAVPAQRAAVVLLEGEPAAGVVAGSRSPAGEAALRLDASISERLSRTEQAFIERVPQTADGREGSVLCAPLWFSGSATDAGRLAGCVVLESGRAAASFSHEHLRLATAIANLASSRLESHRLREQTRDKRRLDEDVRGAARIQASLLPDELPALAGWELAGSSRLCSAVGADYYDFALEDSRLLVALGDVAGKGLAAALLMAALRAAVRALWREPEPLPAVVARVNRSLCETVPKNRYATLLLARLDTADGAICWVNAGHASPLLVRGEGTYESLQDGGTILGAFADASWTEGRARMAQGDVLVLCSDGVFEAARAVSRPLETPELAAVVGRCSGGSAASILAALQAAADERLGGERRADDHTFVVLKRQPR
jgi:serine phosphatase RsbU (regulator of sigma subunit)